VSNIVFLFVSLLGLYLSFREVGWPWGLAAAPLALVFMLLSGTVWKLIFSGPMKGFTSRQNPAGL